MTRYFISFEDGAMAFAEALTAQEFDELSRVTHEVVREAQDAGVWVFGGGLGPRETVLVAPDGTSTEHVPPTATERLGGFAVVDVPTREEATVWAAKFAASCRCVQEVRALLDDSEV